jgi:protein involved in polysaccharide export with SLBB domain
MLGRLFVLFAALLLLAACAGDGGDPSSPGQHPSDPQASADDYRLGAEDKVKVTVFGEPDLSGEFLVDSSGVLSAPFLGQIQVKGMTLREFEAAYAAKLRDAQILRDPRVSAEVTSFRPIYVLGEVKKPGQYAYVSGMTVQKAVALAEGYTYRASEGTVEITRGGKKFTVDVTPQTKVLPGDEIRIPERFF